jgi:hypothetical protein
LQRNNPYHQFIMVQDQLVEYINSQTKAGVADDAIKAALLGAGWQAADVEDSMTKAKGSGAGAAASPIGAAAAGGGSAAIASAAIGGIASAAKSSPASTSPASSPSGPAGPQVIRVSDLVSSTEKTSSFSGSVMNVGKTDPAAAKTDAVMSKIDAGAKAADAASAKKFPSSSPSASSPSSFGASASASSFGAASPVKTKKSYALATESVLGALMVIFGAFAAFLFFQNQGLSAKISALNGQSGSVTSQVSALQQQLNASTTALDAQVASVTKKNSMLALELSFYAVPPSMAPATTTFTTALEGTVSGGGRYDYVITTADGAKVYVSNSKDLRVIALMKPLVGATTSVAQFAGNYVPGADTIAITAVNGTSVTPPPAPATSTATTSAANTSGGAAATGTATTTGK